MVSKIYITTVLLLLCTLILASLVNAVTSTDDSMFTVSSSASSNSDLSCNIETEPITKVNLIDGKVDVKFSFTGEPLRYRFILYDYDYTRGNNPYFMDPAEPMDEIELCRVGPYFPEGSELERAIDNPQSGEQEFTCEWEDGISAWRGYNHEAKNPILPLTYKARVVIYDTPVGAGETPDQVFCEKELVTLIDVNDPASPYFAVEDDGDYDNKEIKKEIKKSNIPAFIPLKSSNSINDINSINGESESSEVNVYSGESFWDKMPPFLKMLLLITIVLLAVIIIMALVKR